MGQSTGLTMPEPFLAFSSSWKKFSSSLPSIYPFPVKKAKQKKQKTKNQLTSELNSKTDWGGGDGEVRGFMENFSSLVNKQVCGLASDRAALGMWVLLSGCLQLYSCEISNRMSLGYAFSSQNTGRDQHLGQAGRSGQSWNCPQLAGQGAGAEMQQGATRHQHPGLPAGGRP